MKIKLKAFKEALDTVKPGVLTTESFEQASHFAFTDGKVFSYNDEICISCPVEGIDSDVAFLGKELYGFISKIPLKQEEIEILYSVENTVNDETGVITNNVTIKAGRIKATFACQHEIKLPLQEEDLTSKGKWTTLPATFANDLAFVSESASTDNLTPATNCIHISKDGYIEATDKYRLTHTIMEDLKIKESVLLPLSAAKVVTSFKPQKVANGKGWIHFKDVNNAILSCRISNAKYAPTDNIIKAPAKKGIVLTLPESILPAIQRAQVFAERKDKLPETISILVQEKKIVVSSTSSETGSVFSESVPYTHSGDSFTFMISPILLISVIKKKQTIQIHGSIIRIEEKGKWIHVAALQTNKEEVE